MGLVRHPAVAGLFYDADPIKLSRNVSDLLNEAKEQTVNGVLRGLISPHAGYVYSGSTAASGYRLLKGKKYDAVVVVGPSHREYFSGISIYPGDGFLTPLGEVPIHHEIREALIGQTKFLKLSELGHRGEHSIEVQLPFLQKSLGAFSFVPVVIGNQRREYCLALGEALARVGRERNLLLVASSDLSHYHPYDEAVGLDRKVVEQIRAFDQDALMTLLEREQVEACGGGPVVAVMHASKALGANNAQPLHYCNSGDITGEKDAVVGYLSAALTQLN
ncbi:MAG TPA: AmmeMemoRadiSam system protein B [Bacteroidetes bacterium]|nr:AmmeMemoRadiSam system protein B [Bacteroidota bacterium]